MRKMITSRIFWITFIISSIVIFLISANVNRTYQARTKVLLLPKNAAIAENLEAITLNAGEIGSSLSFYNMLAKLHEEIEDRVYDLPDYKRLKYWNSIASFRRAGKSGVLLLTVRDPDREQAELISNYSARDISVVMSRYYDIKNELEMRIIDGPVVAYGSLFYNRDWTLISVLSGFVIGAIAYLIASLSCDADAGRRKLPRDPGMVRKNREEMLQEMREKIRKAGSFSRDKLLILSEEEIQKEHSRARSGQQDNPVAAETKREDIPKKKPSLPVQKKPLSFEKKSAAPDNLPVANEFNVSAEEKTGMKEKNTPDSEKSAEIQKKLKEIRDHEATPEEVKRRLNKLLRGEM